MIFPYSQHPIRAAARNRTTKHLPGFPISAQSAISHDTLAVLRTRARYVIGNCSLASGFVRTCVRRVVSAGYRYQSRMRFGNEYLNEENEAIEGISRVVDKNFTVQGHTLKQAAQIALNSFLSDGEVFFVRSIVPEQKPLVRAWQIVHADQVAENASPKSLKGFIQGNKFFLGCEMTPAGRPVAWHFYDDGADVYGIGLGSNRKTRRVPVEDVLHWYSAIYTDIPRGMPPLTPVILEIADVEELQKATLTKVWREACITALMTASMAAEELESADAETDLDKEGYTIQTLPFEQGEIKVINQPGDLTVPESHTPGATYADFIKSSERRQSKGALGISYEKYSGDFSGVSFAGGRLLELDDRLLFRELADDMDEALMRPVYEDRIDMIYDVQRLRPKPRADNHYAVLISHPVPDWVDPLAQARADAVALKNRSISLHKICERQGWEYSDHLKEIEQEEMDLAAMASRVTQSFPGYQPSIGWMETSSQSRSEQERNQEQ